MNVKPQIKAQIRWINKELKEIEYKKKFWRLFIATIIAISIFILQTRTTKLYFFVLSFAIVLILSLALLIVIENYNLKHNNHLNRKKYLIRKYKRI